ncbi:hypothetical protein WUBG_17140 [Wuchereria bancrofti]|uniref:Transcriptional adapter 2-alpha/beta-like domain-containing protein n=1 Tax=Wuchereria bancrofti TaxID=6293 RepID=J9E4Q9_WUCBA|nr:hypothetical protein WUBG_17140 [Wuchereria bancrofti]
MLIMLLDKKTYIFGYLETGKNMFKLYLIQEAYKGKLLVKISEDAKKQLREFYPEQFYANVPLLPFGAEERLKLKDTDLQLLGYMPEREDFEWEFMNDAEKLISRLMLQPGPDTDEDSAFESGDFFSN